MRTSGLNTRWERRTILAGRIVPSVAFVVLAMAALALRAPDLSPWWGLGGALAVALLLHVWMTRKLRRRRAILAQAFPAEWETVLQREVVFFRALSEDERARFRRDLQVFLGEKRITGIKTEIDTTALVLVGASAVIPIFGFPEWEWDQIAEILVYPGRFGEDFELDAGHDRRTLGMVGTGAMNRTMILSKPDLIQGFRNPGDKRNVGLHEFAHLVDKSDGTIDGLPAGSIDRRALGPWMELVRRKMAEIRRGDSDIDPYALTNEAEFFAVATEYFFERPGVMQRKHPQLYAMLEKVFRQDLRGRAQSIAQEIKGGRPSFGRNSPCPCGSGVKYKKCCLAAARRPRPRA